MARAEQTPQSERDLLIIWVDNAAQSIETADRVTDSLRQKCQDIAEMPGIGRQRDNFLPGLRSLAYGKHTIFYRAQDYGISVERVLYGASDIDAAFPAPEDEEKGA